MKYIVMDSQLSYAVLLDEAGRFYYAANQGYCVGQVVEHPVFLKNYGVQRRKRRAAAFLALAACLAVVCFGYYQVFLSAYSSITLTINPQVEILSNRRGDVIALNSKNRDGAALVEQYHFKGKNCFTVTEELVSRSIDMGYLEQGETVHIAVNSPNSNNTQSCNRELSSGLEQLLNGRIAVTLEIQDYKTFTTAAPQSTPDPQQPIDNPSAPLPSVPSEATSPNTDEDDIHDDDEHDDDDDDDDSDNDDDDENGDDRD